MDVNLVLFRQNDSSRVFPLPSSVTIIGRRQDCDLCIPLMIISRRHCELNLDQGKLTIRDLGSRNGTFINGRQIDETEIHPGDQLQVGPISFIVQINGQPEEPAPRQEVAPQPAEDLAKPAANEANDFADLNISDEFSDSHGATEIFNGFSEEPSENGNN